VMLDSEDAVEHSPDSGEDIPEEVKRFCSL